MGSQQRSALMPDKKSTRGPAVSDGLEEPSNRAALVIFLKNEATGETAIWQRKDDRTDNNASWFPTLIRWSLGG
jgi:hypothetical protein